MLELVATTPSRPLGAVVVPLDMSVSLNLFNISLLDRERRYAGYRNYLLYAKRLKFPTVLVPQNQALRVSAKRKSVPERSENAEGWILLLDELLCFPNQGMLARKRVRPVGQPIRQFDVGRAEAGC